MANLHDRSPFASTEAVAMDRDGTEALVVAVAGRFDLPAAGRAIDGDLPVSEKQVPPPIGDVFSDEPGRSSLRWEGQTSLPRLSTDVYLCGKAWAPRGRAVTDMLVGLRLGSCQQSAVVIGDRVWRRGVGAPVPSTPREFTEMPLIYERSFGGACPSRPGDMRAVDPRNPVGRGFYVDNGAALDQPLPNIEQVKQRIEARHDRPPPCGFGPIARHWQPRVGLAGTYDDAWLARRAPLWPADLDPRFFSAAPASLQTARYLTGGEPLVLMGMSPDGEIRAKVPRWRVEAKTITRAHVHRAILDLDAALVEPDAHALTLVWRAAIPIARLGGMGEHEVTVIRARSSAG
jgi:hypothetical protein